MTDGDSAKRRPERLSPSEKRFLTSHPHLVIKITQSARIAERETARRGFMGSPDGPADAFRYCYWSALLARDIGPDNAREYLDAHVERVGGRSGDKAMDLRNNSVGIAIGRSNLAASDTILADRCEWALRFGRLQLVPNN